MAENPRFIVNMNNDLPSIIQAGYLYNTLHVACRERNIKAATRTLELITDLSWLADAYGTDAYVEERSALLLDAMLNTPDKALNNTPLHYACRMGDTAMVELLLSYRACKKNPKNK